MKKAMCKFAAVAAAILFAVSIQTATAEPIDVGNDTVEFVEVVYDFPNPGESTWFYTVVSGGQPTISHVGFELNLDCLEIAGDVDSEGVVHTGAGTWTRNDDDTDYLLNQGAGKPEIVDPDPTTELTGLKFDEGFEEEGESHNYFITVKGNLTPGSITFASKGGNGFDTVEITGPSLECVVIQKPCRELPRTSASCDWYMIAPSCNTGNTGVYDLYSDDHSGKYCHDDSGDDRTAYPGGKWRVWRDEDDITSPYVDSSFPLGPDDPVKLGEGYWMCITDRPVCIDVPSTTATATATATPTEDCGQYGGEQGKQCFAVDVKKTKDDLDIIGHPFPNPVLWNSVKVACKNGSEWSTLSPEDAHEAGILSKNYYTYNANAYATHSVGHTLEPQTGYWVRTMDNFEECSGGVKLLIPAPE